MKPRIRTLLVVSISLALPASWANASGVDPAVVAVQALSTALLKSMKTGSAVPMAARYRELEPVIERVFALPLMTRLSVGPDWRNFEPGEQEALITAFSRYTIANYAHNFHSFDGQTFQVEENVVVRGEEKVVRSRIIPRDGTPANLLYRLLEVNGSWKIVDVYYDGVSQLILHRTDFSGAIAAGGAPALIAHLKKDSDDLMN